MVDVNVNFLFKRSAELYARPRLSKRGASIF
jgi:hypothetical protein